MHQTAQPGKRGSYTANLLGNIRSHLAGLQGYDVMALELIQNADDAKADKIVFDITHDGLVVRNSGAFTYCGALESSSCVFEAETGYNCDYHRITDVGSGGKLFQSENIGRFGIGFLSAYQITDRPEICSAGIKLTLVPEAGEWSIEELRDHPPGTTFILPWARDPDTAARRGMGVSHVTTAHIDRLAEDFRRVLQQSLLFLRHVRVAEVRREGALLQGCDLDRGDESDLIVTFRPGGDVQQWHILRTDAAEAAKHLCVTHPQLQSLDRRTEVSIGLRTDPQPLTEGLLYAFLPTEQTSGLPLHINADFFPESDRKAVIFKGHQHEQVWNEMLVKAGAEEIARDPEGLLDMLGHVPLWQIIGKAYELALRPSGHPACYTHLWERLKATAMRADIVQAQDGTVRRPDEVFLPSNPLTTDQANALHEVGGRLASEELRPFWTAMDQLGATILTLDRLVDLLNSAMAPLAGQATRVDENRLTAFYKPLWSLVSELLPDSVSPNSVPDRAVRRLRSLPFVVTEKLCAVAIDESHAAPPSLTIHRVAALLPGLAFASRHFLDFPRLGRFVRRLDLETVVSHIGSRLASERVEDVIAVESEALRGLYGLFADLDDDGDVDPGVYETLAGLPIWRSARGLVKATEALLPGDFTDPTGQANLLDTSVLFGRARDFVSTKLGVRTQTIDSYVETVLPNFFDEDGPADSAKYRSLITELATHSVLIDEDGPRRILGSLPIVPTQDGGWSRPAEIYRRSDVLVKALGDATHLWLDETRLPNAPSVRAFVDGIGILQSATPGHLADRILEIADEFRPTDDAKQASSEAFYVLCDHYDQWKEDPSFRKAIGALRASPCLPAQGDAESWHVPDSVYAPYRADAFRSQVPILEFRNPTRLQTGLLEALGITINPSTELVIEHLKHCMETNSGPHVSTYQFLNERAQVSDHLVSTLAGTSCIYVESQGTFVRTNQVYWVSQQLGRYAFTIPASLRSFTPLFEAIGVKDTPECSDYIDILLDIVGAHFERGAPVTGADRAIYDTCLAKVADAHHQDECAPDDLRRLREAPTILNLRGMATHPDEILIHDSEWLAKFFDQELDRALCRLRAEICPLAMKLGARRLSESASVSLEFVDGEMQDETMRAEKLRERTDIFARLLHDEPVAVRASVCDALSEINAVSYEVVRIEASVSLLNDPVFAPPKLVDAFYDIKERRLTIRRPINDRSWASILNAIFHQLMRGATGIEISKLALGVRPLMGMTVEEAHLELTDAGVPGLDEGPPSVDPTDVASQELGEPGTREAPTSDGMTDVSAPTAAHADSRADGSGDHPGDRVGDGQKGGQGDAGSGHAKQRPDQGNGRLDSDRRRPKRTERPKYKQQWERRLLSYVRRIQANSPEGDQEPTGPWEHNQAVESVARAAVCAYEKERGRSAEQMAQGHPGYDIISHDPLTGEDRLIEVKGIAGEWNQTGVGLSRTQFSNAQNSGDGYWLYVVEFALDPESLRVHAIRNPAMQVTSFMFDGNWREAATDEHADPTMRFVPGVRVQHKRLGTGEIVDVVARGRTKQLTIRFDDKDWDTPHVPLNLYQMRILEVPDDDDPS